jgi:3-methyl-D-ornithine--L-lysine ligase PylC-like protein
VEIFKAAVGDRSRVFACDSSAEAPALQKADKAFIVPRVDGEDYIDTLLAICEDHQIGLLVPALEPELSLLARTRARFLAIGTVPLVSPLRSLLRVATNWRCPISWRIVAFWYRVLSTASLPHGWLFREVTLLSRW